jgi:hypothetical protein
MYEKGSGTKSESSSLIDNLMGDLDINRELTSKFVAA